MKILNIDCMEYMAAQTDNSFDLAIVDPPYGINVTKMKMGGRKTVEPDRTKNWDSCAPDSSYFDELKRVSKKPNNMGRQLLHIASVKMLAYLGQRRVAVWARLC